MIEFIVETFLYTISWLFNQDKENVDQKKPRFIRHLFFWIILLALYGVIFISPIHEGTLLWWAIMSPLLAFVTWVIFGIVHEIKTWKAEAQNEHTPD